jgi:putative ATP-dependent endonuclease of OLD family
MKIKRIVIHNFKSIRDINLELNPDLNIIVGNNETGKSTIIEAIYLALSGTFQGRKLSNEISPFIFSQSITQEYVESLAEGNSPQIPKSHIELYLEENEFTAALRGTNNTLNENSPGIKMIIEFNNDYKEEYEKYIEDPTQITTIPTEYYKVSWLSFANKSITRRSIPLNSTLIDTTTIRLQYGSDFYMQKIINDQLDPKEKSELSLQYRKLKESFSNQESIKAINDKLKKDKGLISEKDLKVSIDISSKTSWEANLTSYLNDIPYQFIGKGEQSILKMLLALERKGETNDVILIEEPENHLSYSNMNYLLRKINEKCSEKQLIITTHSPFVANKLGLDKLIVLGQNQSYTRLNALEGSTQKYFKKISGYDTLRFILAKTAILVEGPSDELIVQKAYMNKNEGKLPIEDSIDIITVRGLSFKRFLQIAKLTQSDVRVVTDNDGDFGAKITDKYAEFDDTPTIRIHASEDNSCPTLEPQLLNANDLATCNKIIAKKYATEEELIHWMTTNKTDSALLFFDYAEEVKFPKYIMNAISE